MFELVFLSGARAGEVVDLAERTSLGRSPDCVCEVPDPNASRRHAEMTLQGQDRVLLNDLGSANGSFVNEERIDQKFLQPGDIVRLGETRMRVQAKSGRNRIGRDQSNFDLNMSGIDEDPKLSLSMSMLAEMPRRQLDPEILKQRLDVVIWVSEALASLKTMDEIYDPVLDTLFEVFPQIERGFILLGDGVDNLIPCARRNRRGGGDDGLTVSRSLCKAALEKKSVVKYEEGGDTDFDQGMSLIALNIRCAMVVPLLVREEVLGLLVVDTTDRRRSFAQEDMELAESVCRQIAAALKNVELLREMEIEAENRRNLMRFLPKPVVDQVTDGSIDLNLGGNNYEGTVFFSDVVGFTRVSETMNPQEVVSLMNSYFDRMVPAIEVTGGAIDKFMGDAIMAFWGIPFNDGKSALHAVQSALAMQNALIGFNAIQREAGRPELDMAIGLNTGPVVAGNIGAQDRLEYTLLGDTVNTAQRIESRGCTSQVLVSESTWAACTEAAFGFHMPAMKAKNKAEPLPSYSVRGIEMAGDEILMHLPLLCDGYTAYLIRRLADQSFILVHDRSCTIDGAIATFHLPEQHDCQVGPIQLVEQLPMQAVDGGWVRSLIHVPDVSLGGLLSKGVVHECACGWEDMPRTRR